MQRGPSVDLALPAVLRRRKGKTTAKLKAVYSGDMVYFLVQYADPTNSIRRGPFQKQADFIIDGNQVPFDDSQFKAGDEVASFLIFPLKGNRADINGANLWANGVMTSEVSRKLTTGSKFDVQFSDMSAKYGFGFATFDNAQVRHAVHYGPLYLTFVK